MEVVMQQRRETAFEEEMRYTRAAFDSVGEGIITADAANNIDHINPSALKILGYDLQDALHKPFRNVLVAVDEHGQTIDFEQRPCSICLKERRTVSAKLYYKTKSGTSVPVSVTVSPIYKNNKVIGAIEILHDISDEQEFDQLKSEFISLASHQLRTPLTAISTYAHMLVAGFKGPLAPAQLEFLNTILVSADRMNSLIDTLLSVSRLESGNMVVNTSKVDVNRIVSKAKQELWPLAKAKRQFLITRSPAGRIELETDELLLTEICTNLISNAIKYTPADGKITIDVTRNDESVVLAVTDTGYGIPKHLQQRVFSKFFRAPNILHEEAVGTGLGLYLVKEMIISIGGTITFKSRENSGSTFTVILPLNANYDDRKI